MTIKQVLPGQGLLIDQAPLTGPARPEQVTQVRNRHAAAVAEAEAWLAEQGMDPWEIAELDLPRKVRHAWLHDEHGFVPKGWSGKGARPVLIVHVPVPEPAPAPDPAAPIEVPVDR